MMQYPTHIKTDLERTVYELLVKLGQDPTREGLIDTPKRYAKFLVDALTPEPFEMTTFDHDGGDIVIVEKNIPFHSLCEHHIVPFHGTATIGYVPHETVLGLSKMPRVLDHCAKGLQTQERITEAVADTIHRHTQCKGVAVILEAEHLCMSMRGVKKHGTKTKTAFYTGVMFNDRGYRDEFHKLAI